MKLSKAVRDAFQAAVNARNHSYSPYSRFKVGAALQVRGVADPVGGCNVENASYGATICAERTALLRAVAEHGQIRPEFLVVITGEPKATVPCALCLQMLAEFADDNLPIYLGNTKRILKSYKLRDLLPKPFRAFKADR